MRKFHALLTAFLVMAIAATAVTGCSSEESTARKYVEQARQQTKDVATNQDKVKKKGEELAELFQLLGDPPTSEDAQKMRQLTAELSGLIDASNKAAQKTRPEYEKVLKLKDVADYKAYARNKIEVLEILDQLAALHKQYWAIYNQAFEDYLAGGTVDEEAIKALIDSIVEQRDKLNTQLEQLNKKATDLADKLDIE